MSLESLQRDGRAAYDSGDFSKALEFFNRAVGRGNPSIKLLDSVSATHIKLGALDAALAAAKKTIQTGREDATGYLRAGQILTKMEKASTALEIYAYGLKSIKHVGVGFEKLKKAHDELQQQQAPKNSLDPMTVLPRELAIAVLEYLNFRQRIAICRVSKGWTKLIRSEPALWTHLDLSGARKKVRTTFISTAINVARKKLTTATLNQLWDFDKVLAALVKHCPLESLRLANTGLQAQNLVAGLKQTTKLKELVSLLGTEMTGSTLGQVLETCKCGLEILKLASAHGQIIILHHVVKPPMPLLRSFSFEAPHVRQYWQGLDMLANQSPLLQSLTLHVTERHAGDHTPPIQPLDLRRCANLTHLDLRMPIASERHLLLPVSLRVLNLATTVGNGIGSNFFSQHDEQTSSSEQTTWDLPHLEEVGLDLPALPFHRAVIQINGISSNQNQQASSLTSFSIRNGFVSDMALAQFGLSGRLSEVRYLDVTDYASLQDRHVDILLQSGKKLESLNLSGTSITGVAVKSIVKAGHVKRLVINDCTKVGRDAIDWARAEGLNVKFKVTSLESGGKRIRY